MTERMIPVPESLIEALRDAHGGPDLDDAAGALIEMLPDSYSSALLSQPEPSAEADPEPCMAETHSWDHFRPEQLDAYWIRCTEYGKHDEHRDSNTGLTWRDPSTIRDVTPPPTTPEGGR